MSLTRARSRLLLRITLVSSRRFVKFLNLFWKASPERESSSSARSSVLRSRRSLAFMRRPSLRSSNQHARGDRQLVGRQAKRFARHVLGDSRDLVHHAPRLHDGSPFLGRTFSATHADLERLPGDRMVGENADPELARALDVAGDGHAGRLDLPRGETSGLQGLQPEVAESDARPAPREAAVVAL